MKLLSDQQSTPPIRQRKRIILRLCAVRGQQRKMALPRRALGRDTNGSESSEYFVIFRFYPFIGNRFGA